MSDTSTTHVQPGAFATTHWSVVCRAGNADAPMNREALEALCRAYWFPIYAYIRRRGYAVEDAQDLTQQFFTRMLESNLFAKADPARGRFRSFLLGSVGNFLANERDRANAKKRGGGKALIPIQTDEAETRYGVDPADTRTPEQTFEYNWALALLDQVMKKLQASYADDGQLKTFLELKPFIVAVPSEESRDEIARRLGMSEGALRVAIHRLRGSYRELLRAEIAHTLDSEADVEAEMRHLFRVLSKK